MLLVQGCAGATARWNPKVWARNISAEDVRNNYPALALSSGMGGLVSLQCKTSLKGEMTDCRVMSETPSDQGFGEVALRLSDRMQMRTDVETFRPNAKVRFDVTFNPTSD
jgi:protein TonB